MEDEKMSEKQLSRRQFLSLLGLGTAGIAATATAASTVVPDKKKELYKLKVKEYFQKHYRYMTSEEKQAVVTNLERKVKLQQNLNVTIKTTPAQDDVRYVYALNISKCEGYRDCVTACRKENNLPEDGSMDYIRVYKMKNGHFNVENEAAAYEGDVPQDGEFFLPTQCMQCENPPCIDVCPTEATWKEKDGITVIDYNWCVGCRYCQAACPYNARRFNWQRNQLPASKINTNQHYLGNRERPKGSMEKCHFCTHRTREGKQPACQEACPTGARVFGNLLDTNSEVRWILANKKVFRLKEELNTDPQFFYYMD
jgi:Fe-S-cluster-containing dehydrogenase component